MTIQIAIPARYAPLALCSCGARPHHIAMLGRGNAPGNVARLQGHGVHHRFECSRCGRKTPLQRSKLACEQVWGAPGDQRALPLLARGAA